MCSVGGSCEVAVGIDTTGTGGWGLPGVDCSCKGVVDTTGTRGCSCEGAVGCVLPVVKHTHTDITGTVYTCVHVYFHSGLGLSHSTEGYLSNGGYEHSRESVQFPTDLHCETHMSFHARDSQSSDL